MKKRRTVLLILVGLLVVLALAVPVRAGPIVLWDQPIDFQRLTASTYFIQKGEGQYAADDFSNASPWNLERILVQSSVNKHELPASAQSLNWFIYPDAAGVPAGYPGGGGALWSHSCSPGAWEVSISVGSGGPYYRDITLDIVKAQGAPLYLPPGNYWLVFYPVVSKSDDGYWWHSAGTTNLAVAQLMSPTGYYYPTTWTAWTTYKPTTSAHDLAFRLEGTVSPPPNVKYLHSQGGLFNLTAPVGTQWHELWPFFCNEYHLSSWEDNGDSVLSPSDQIDMYQKPDGEVRWYHVDEVTITLNVTPARGEPMYIELEGGYNASVLTNPVGSQWHEIYPDFCRQYELIDRNPREGELGYCYLILLLNKQTGEETWWHVEEVAIDIIVTPKPPPVGGEAYPVNKVSLLAPWIAVAVLLGGGTSWFVLRRRRTQG